MVGRIRNLALLFVLCFFVGSIQGDTPANCTFEDIRGSWIFYETERNGDNTIDCFNDSMPDFFTAPYSLFSKC